MADSLTRCWAEIDADALAANVSILKKFRPEIMAVVKANAYGHDVDIIVPLLRSLDVRHYAVATVDEAAELRRLPHMADSSIYLMAAVLAGDVPQVVSLDLIPFATDSSFVARLSDEAAARGKTARVHLEVDTGIGRAGVSLHDLEKTLKLWQSLPALSVTGVCTHFTAADAEGSSDSLAQFQLFKEALASLPADLVAGKAIHAANSPASLRLPISNNMFFRPGLLLYGISPLRQESQETPFKPVLSLKARVLLVRRLPEGTDISYSRTYRLPHEANIATVGIGYGDGYPRRLSNIGTVLLPSGAVAPIRGRVCMDQLCIELPGNEYILPGDIVTLIGKAGENAITAAGIAETIRTTPHEITTCLTSRVTRMLIDRR